MGVKKKKSGENTKIEVSIQNAELEDRLKSIERTLGFMTEAYSHQERLQKEILRVLDRVIENTTKKAKKSKLPDKDPDTGIPYLKPRRNRKDGTDPKVVHDSPSVGSDAYFPHIHESAGYGVEG